MNIQKNRQPSALKGRFKRGTAILLALAMIVTAPTPGMSFVSRAENLPKNGGTEGTAYIFNQNWGPQIYGVFDLQGIKDPARIGSSEPYRLVSGSGTDEDFEKSISVTRGYTGFRMSLRSSDNKIVSVENLTDGNGSTAVFSDQGVQLTISARTDNVHDAVIFDYTMKNLKNTNNVMDWSTYANIRLGALGVEKEPYDPSKDPADASRLSINSRGFYMLNKSTNQSFECITKDSALDVDQPNTRWIGSTSNMGLNQFNNSAADYFENGDSAMAYSYKFELAPNETMTKKIAFRVNNTSYYVSQEGNDGNLGAYTSPLKTVDAAINKIKAETTNTTKTANIYFQGDYQMPNSVEIPDGYTIIFSSADYNRDGGFNEKVFTVTRPSGDNKPMFKTGQSGGIRLKNIILDGGGVSNSAPMVSGVGTSTVSIDREATLQNNNLSGAAASTGSAVAIFDHAKLDLDSCSIINNISEARTNPDNSREPSNLHNSAVYFANPDVFDASGYPYSPFTIKGPVRVDGNTRTDGTKADVYLYGANAQFITVTGNIDGAKVGIASSILPELTTSPSAANQSVTVVRPKVVNYSPIVELSNFVGSFYADQQGEAGHPGIYTAVSGSGARQNIVLKRGSFNMSFAAKAEAGVPSLAPPLSIASLPYEAGVSVTTPPAPDLKDQGYKLSRTVFTPAAPTLKADPVTGVITGTMPANNVKVDYYYKELKSSITFHTNGGTPADIPKWEGQAGKPAGKPVPAVSKTGYRFVGWSQENNGAGSAIVPSGFFDKYPSDEIDVYAIFVPDTHQKYAYTLDYTDETGDIHFKTVTSQLSVEDLVPASLISVPGYTLDIGSSEFNPKEYAFYPSTVPVSVGGWNSAGVFEGKMPAQGFTIHYVYTPDPSPQAGLYPLTVNYVTKNNTVLHAPAGPSGHKAGSEVHVGPEVIDRYTCVGARIDKGMDADPSAGIAGVLKPPTAPAWQWDDKMPNQEVVLTYIYEPTKEPGGTTPSYRTSVSYVDDDTKDSDKKNIRQPVETSWEVDSQASGTYDAPYGYTEMPDKREIATNSPQPDMLAIQFDTGGSWRGPMPAGDVAVTYHHARNQSQWANITYKPGKHGVLKDGKPWTGGSSDQMSGDVTAGTGPDMGTYKAAVLKQGTGTGETGYAWQNVKDKGLLPAYKADPHYTFSGWFVDENNNGVLDGAEKLMDAAQTFTNDSYTVTASFTKVKSEWMDIRFWGEKGKYASGDQTLNVPRKGALGAALTWGELKQQFTLPSYTPWVHYADAGWYTKAGDAYTKVEDATALTEGQTYIRRFVPAPGEKHDVSMVYKNESGTVTFGTGTEMGRLIEDFFALPAKAVPGYTFDPSASTANPGSFQFDPDGVPESVGGFDGAGFQAAKMPGGNLALDYRYKVDPSQIYKLTVKRVSANGVDLGGGLSEDYPAEQPVSFAQATAVPGYRPGAVPYEITAGNKPGDMLTTVTSLNGGNGQWTFAMPNQDVTIILKYEGDASVKKKITERYMDGGSQDDALKKLSDVEHHDFSVDQPVRGSYKQPYGYVRQGDPAVEYADPGVTPKDITFNGNDWSGHMPASDVDITYSNSRAPGKWAQITYKAGANGSLSLDGSSPDVTQLGTAGEYKAEVLKDDGTPAGTKAAYDFAVIQAKRLMPTAVLDDPSLYYCEGWFVDKNNNGTRDQATEPLVDAGYKFKGEETLTASFVENAGAWVDLNFRAEKGTLALVPLEITHVPDTYTWGMISGKLKGAPWNGYKEKGWLDGSGHLMTDGDVLKTGMYTYECIPDEGQTHVYQVLYTNSDGTVVLGQSEKKQLPIDAPLEADKINVPGYVWDKDASQDVLPSYDPDGPDGPEAAKQPGVFNVQGHFTGKMPGQDLTLVYRYKGDQSATYTLTEKYIDTGSADLQEISSIPPQSKHPDEPVSGQYQAPFGYQKDPNRSFTIEPSEKGIAFDTEDPDKWSGHMPAGDVTVTYYNQRIQDDPSHPYWGDVTYLPGANGSLTLGQPGEASPDVRPSRSHGYKASILLDDESAPRPEAYTWGMILAKKLVPKPEPNAYYEFKGWYEDVNGNGVIDAGDQPFPGLDADAATFKKPTTLIASFGEKTGDWLDIHFTTVNGSMNQGESAVLHINKDQKWQDIESRLPKSTPWDGYVEDGWHDAGGTRMMGESPLSDGAVYTHRYKPDPNVNFDYTVKYQNEDGSIVFKTTPAKKHLVNDAVGADREAIPGYQWDKDGSTTDPKQYAFDPFVDQVDVGRFDPATGRFTGNMPKSPLTVIYKYRLKDPHDPNDPATPFNLTVNYETSDGAAIHQPYTAPLFPEDPIIGPDGKTVIQPEKVDGYTIKGCRFDAGKSDQDSSGNPVQPVQGEPDPNNGYQWSGRMPNQDVTLTYLYKVDQTKTYGIIQRYVDEDALADIQDVVPPASLGKYPAGAGVSGTYEQPYGYTRTGQSVSVNPAWDITPDIQFDSQDGSWSGTMPPREMEITYQNHRIQEKWKTITYKVGTQNLGILSKEGTHVTPSGSDYTADVLINDEMSPGAEDQSYTLGEIEAKGLAPKTVPNKYYQFKGWFVDGNSDGILNNREAIVSKDQTFSDATTLTACFEENPDLWVDVQFAGEHATINDETKTKLHIQSDKSWGDLGADKLNLLPAYTAEVNYKADSWYDEASNTKMTDDTPLKDGYTYTISCYQDPDIFGTDVKTPEASGGLDGRGKGRIAVYNTSEASYSYILTDLGGNVLAVVPRRSLSQKVEFDSLSPGARYNVYEAARELAVKPGDMIQGKGETGKTISSPAPVLTPVLDGNYQVYYDEGSEDEAKTKLSIQPADPDTDYALVDARGNAVQLPGSQTGGWLTPSRVSPSLQLPGLDYEADYTVVSRPRGQTEVTAQSRVGDGTLITTDPVGELALKHYIIQTTDGQVDQVGETQVRAESYREAVKGCRVILSAPKTNADGEAFVRWKAAIGILEGQKVHAYEEDSLEKVSFDMPGTNLVMTPVYNHRPNKASPSNATVTDEVRGGNREEIALDPQAAPEKEAELTKTKDRELMDQNKAEVDYHVVYKKGRVKPREKEAVQTSADYGRQSHEKSFHGAWSLNVSVERYVNGRRVELTGPSTATANNARPSTATGSSAAPKATGSSARPSGGQTDAADASGPVLEFPTYVQMSRDDVDMMDYQLYEITEDENGKLTASLVLPDSPYDDPEETGGLLTFTAKAGSRYVMVYSRAYRVHFINEPPFLSDPPVQPVYYDFKVRRMDRPKAPEYAGGYDDRPDPEGYLFNTKSGAEYHYRDWSYSANNLKPFDPEKPVKGPVYLYANYENNEEAVAKERELLKAVIEDAWKLSGDPFMKRQDKNGLRTDTGTAQGVLQQENPRSKEDDLREARETLLERMKHYQELIQNSHKEYEDIQSGTSGGGSGGGGGGGKGVVKDPFNATPVNTYTVGTNGNWKIMSHEPNQEKELAFVLNGGLLLRSMWARLMFPDKPESNGWYHFNSNAILDTGWFVDEKGKWYYGNKETEGCMGKMVTGWHKDALDGRWYCLDPVNGDMATGWKQINGKWYYLEPVGGGTYTYDPAAAAWNYTGGSGHPLGSLYQNETTPDGYKVDENGVWLP